MSGPKNGSMLLFNAVTRAMDMDHSDPPTLPHIKRDAEDRFSLACEDLDDLLAGPADWLLDAVQLGIER